MPETITRYFIQAHSDLFDRGWTDLENQLTRGYENLEQAREAFATQFNPAKLALIYGGFRIVERTVTETPYGISPAHEEES